MAVGAAALALTMAGLGFLLWPRDSAPTGAASNRLLQNLQISQVTVTGNAWRPALSPDGKYVVYVRRDELATSLRMRQLGTDRDVEIVAARRVCLSQAAMVTPDGSFVDFARGKADAPTLWRVPFLGGSAKRLLDNVDSPIGWSPDGHRFAFVRAGFEGSSALLVADADGTNERTVATRKLPAQFLSFGSRGGLPAPRGGHASRLVAGWKDRRVDWIRAGCRRRDTTGGFRGRGERRRAIDSTPGRAAADGIEWLDAGHLIVSVEGRNDAVAQLWVLSYPEGDWSRLTNDLSNYASFGVSADRQSMAVARWDHQVAISVLEGASSEPFDTGPAGTVCWR